MLDNKSQKGDAILQEFMDRSLLELFDRVHAEVWHAREACNSFGLGTSKESNKEGDRRRRKEPQTQDCTQETMSSGQLQRSLATPGPTDREQRVAARVMSNKHDTGALQTLQTRSGRLQHLQSSSQQCKCTQRVTAHDVLKSRHHVLCFSACTCTV